MDARLNENEIELATLEDLKLLGYEYIRGGSIAPDSPAAERQSFSDIILEGRLIQAIQRLNPDVPVQAQREAFL